MERDATSQEATKVQDRTNEWSSKIVFATKVNDSKNEARKHEMHQLI